MTDLFHPELPGAVTQSGGFRRSGWREWDDLSDDEKQAHEAAVAELEKQSRRDEREAAARLKAVADAQHVPDEPAEKNEPAKKAPAKKAATRRNQSKE